MNTVFVFDADAADNLGTIDEADRIVALTPNAQAWLKTRGISYDQTSALLNDAAHFDIERRIRQAETELAKQLASVPASQLCSAARETLRHDLRIVAGIALISRHLLQSGPWGFVRAGSIVRHTELSAAHRELVGYIRERRQHFRALLPHNSWPALTNMTGLLCATMISGRDTIAITGYHYGLKRIAKLLPASSPRLKTLQLRAGGSFAFVHNIRTLLARCFGGVSGTLCVTPGSSRDAKAAAFDAITALSDEDIGRGIDEYGRDIAIEAEHTHAMSATMEKLLSKLSPRAILAHSLRWGDEAALGEAADRRKLPCYLASHGSHAANPDALAHSAVTANADGLLTSPFASTVICQSPHAENLAADMTPSTRRLNVRPIMWGMDGTPLERKGPPVFRFLHAGTFKQLTGPRPLIYETADEYVSGLCDLVHGIAAVPDVFLTIRVRSNPECSIEALKALLPNAPNMEIKSDGAFRNDLMNSDALISFASTTIEEALSARRPVVLWGGTRRYHHLPARTVPPTPDERAAIYAPPAVSSLESFLSAVARAHKQKPLEEHELAAHAWPLDNPGLENLCDDFWQEGKLIN